jgi:hypothetical protein
VETSIAAVEGQVLTVKYKQGGKVDEKKITVTPKTIIVAMVAGSKDDLKAGARFVAFRVVKQADGSLQAGAISVGRGIAPPM